MPPDKLPAGLVGIIRTMSDEQLRDCIAFHEHHLELLEEEQLERTLKKEKVHP
jgi:hypothetical protein